jgi:ABC-type branched-subunit amino acid transport system ATPase component
VSVALLRVEGLVKSFHGNRAVDDVSFDVPAGHARGGSTCE